jgi:uncharacterized membrane protein YbhN (UPF0104 family)
MKETLITFGSIVAILCGAILIYANVSNRNFLWELEGQIRVGLGVILLAAGVTRLWMKRRLEGSR